MTALTPAALAEMEQRAREALAGWTVLAPDAHADVLALLAERARLSAVLDQMVADVATGKEDDPFGALVELANSLAGRE